MWGGAMGRGGWICMWSVGSGSWLRGSVGRGGRGGGWSEWNFFFFSLSFF